MHLPAAALPFALLSLLSLLTSATALPVFHTNLPGSYPERVEDLIPRSYRPPISKPQRGVESNGAWHAQVIAAARSVALHSDDDQDTPIKVGSYGYKEKAKWDVANEDVASMEIRRAQQQVQQETRRRIQRDIRW